MPIVRFEGACIECKLGDNLRRVLLDAKLPLYNKLAKPIHCRGLGVCGMCAVKLRGSVSWPTKIESLRMRLPPHKLDAGLRLACQCSVHGDLVVERFKGIWGQHVSASREEHAHSVHHKTASDSVQSKHISGVDLLAHRGERCSAAGQQSGWGSTAVAVRDQQAVLESMVLDPQRRRLASMHKPRRRPVSVRRHVSAMSPLARRDHLRLRAQSNARLCELRDR